MEIELKNCKNKKCNNKFRQYNSLQQYCSFSCKKEDKKVKPIRQIGSKMVKRLTEYSRQRPIFLDKPKNKRCPVTGERTNQIHHKKGRKGYADKWARDNDVWLLNDERFFLAVSEDGHREIEGNTTWAMEQGYSLSRLENLDK
jgi:hypothetical protein